MEMVSIEVKNGTENTNYECISWPMKRERNEKRVKKASESEQKKNVL